MPHTLTIGTYVSPTQGLPDEMIGLGNPAAGGTLEVLFGPDGDNKARYVAQICASHRVLGRLDLCVAEGMRKAAGTHHTAVLDEKGRPWALTGAAGDKAALTTATLLAGSDVFRGAVEAARTEHPVVAGQPAGIPNDIARFLVRREAGVATAEEATQAAAFLDQHWSDPTR